MRFIYRRGLRLGKPNQDVSLQIDEHDDVLIHHAGLFSRWECRVPFAGILDVRVNGETLEIDVAGAEGVATIVFNGPDTRAVQRRLARLLEFADAVTEFTRELSQTPRR